MVTLTDQAAEKVKELLAAEGSAYSGLRVAIRGGGCSGFQYALAFDSKHDDDQVFEQKDVKILVDPESLEFVDGSEVDFVDGLQGTGFSVSNPNVVASCGCGSSFRVADEAPSCG